MSEELVVRFFAALEAGITSSPAAHSARHAAQRDRPGAPRRHVLAGEGALDTRIGASVGYQ